MNRALLSDASGKVAVSSVSDIELGYVSGVTSAIQTHLNAKQATISGGVTTGLTVNYNINKVVLTDASAKLGTHQCLSTQ